MLYEQLGQEPAGLIDASELPAIGERAWLSRLDAMLASGTAVGIEAVHAASTRRATARDFVAALAIANSVDQ